MNLLVDKFSEGLAPAPESADPGSANNAGAVDLPGGAVMTGDRTAGTIRSTIDNVGDTFTHALIIPDAANQMTVQSVRGEVVVIRVNGDQALLTPGDVLEIGDVVLAGDRGVFDVASHDGTNTTFAGNSRLVVEPMSPDPAAAARVFVIQGEFVLQPGAASSGSGTEIRTPVATVSSRGGRLVGRAALEAQSNSFVLLPDAVGTVGVVSVATAAGVVVLDKAFSGAEVLSTVRAPVGFDGENTEQVLSEFGQEILSQIGAVAGRPPAQDEGIFDSIKNLLGLGETGVSGPVARGGAEISGDGGDDVITGQVESDPLVLTESKDDFRLDLGDNNDNAVIQTIDIPAEGEIFVQGGAGADDLLTLNGRDDVNNSATVSDVNGEVVTVFENSTVRAVDFEEFAVNLGALSENLVIGDLSQTDIADNTVIIDAGGGDDLVDASLTARSLKLTGGAGADTLLASTSDDTLNGGIGDDVLRGGGAVDQGDELFGGDGNDTLDGGGGDDLIDGGAGVDNLEFASAAAGVDVDLEQGTSAGQGADTLVSVENVTGTALNDTLAGNADANLLQAGAGDDLLSYKIGAGNDTLGGGAGADTLNTALVSGENTAVVAGDGQALTISSGQAGAPAATVTGVETLTVSGTDAAETVTIQDLTGSEIAAGGVNVAAGGGNDTVDAGALVTGASLAGDGGDDSLRGGTGDDTLDGGAGTDVADFSAAVGNMVVDLSAGTATGQGADRISGVENIVTGDGNDEITSDALADNNLSSGAGNDTLIAAGGNDTFQGGAGTDVLDLSNVSADAVVQLADGTISIGNDTGSISGIEVVAGGTGSDTINGAAVAETIAGGAGDDVIDAGGGDDLLNLNVADNGRDLLSGGAGDDTLTALGTDGTAFVFGISADDGKLVVDTGGQDAGITAGDAVIDSIETVSLTGADGNDIFNVADFTGATGIGAGGIVLNGGAGNNALVLGSDGGNAIVDLSVTGDQNIGLGTLRVANVQNVVAGDGDDTLTGSDVANILRGAAGDDSLNGGNGDDTLVGGAGDDVLNGGADTDVADYSETTDLNGQVFDLNQNVFDIAGQGQDTLISIEGIIAGGGNDTLNGTTDRNFLDGGAGNDVVDAGRGNDIVRAGVGNDTLAGGLDIDELDLSAAQAQNGTTAGVTVDLTAGQFSGGGLGDNSVSGFEQVTGSALDDSITATAIDETLNGADGDDQLFGGLGADSVIGGQGADTLDGGGGGDTVFGEQGNDSIIGGDGDDDLDGGTGDDTLFGGEGNDTLNGQAGSDSLFGGGGDDVLSVSFGKNTLDGGVGNDVISGKDNQDTLIGGAGSDTLTGEGGSDRFEFNNGDTGDGGIDLITDFEVGADKVKISAADFENLATDNGQLVDGTSFVSVASLGDDLGTDQATFVFDRSNGNLHFDPDGSGNTASFEIATVQFSSGTVLQATDFQVG